MRMNWRLTITNISQYWWVTGYYVTKYYHLQAGIDATHDGETSVVAPEWLLICWSTDVLPLDNVLSAPPVENVPTIETIDSHEPYLTFTPDQSKTELIGRY